MGKWGPRPYASSWGTAVTSEVMLLNTQGGALAADSALTAIEYHENGTASVRYQTGTEKIFILDQKLPVASMIFDVAEFYRYPWATIFEAFVARRPVVGQHASPKVAAVAGQFLVALDLRRRTQRPQTRCRSKRVQERLSFAIYIAALVQRYHQCVELASGRRAPPTQVERWRARSTCCASKRSTPAIISRICSCRSARRRSAGRSWAKVRRASWRCSMTYLDRLLTGMLRAMFGEGTVPPTT